MTPQEILKKQYELKYKPQKYENSIVKTVQEDFVVKAMNEYTKQRTSELLKVLIQLNEGFKSEWGNKDNSDRVCKNLDYWNKIASVAIKKYKS